MSPIQCQTDLRITNHIGHKISTVTNAPFIQNSNPMAFSVDSHRKFLCYIKQIDSMLPCVCTVIDHRGRQNVLRTSVTHSVIAPCTTFLLLPHFDVICDLLLNIRTATWNLFVKLRKLLHYNWREANLSLMFLNIEYRLNFRAWITTSPLLRTLSSLSPSQESQLSEFL